jgi:hypothetical protein
MKNLLPLAVLAALLAAPAAHAADDPLLSRLAGSWVGQGTYKQNAGAKEERIYCRITNTLVQNGKALQQRGRCSVASNSGSVDGTITANGGGSYSGQLNSLASIGPAKLSGSGSGNRLTMNMTFTDALTKKAVSAVSTTTLSGSGYRLTTRRQDGGWTGSDISFTEK